MDGQMTFPWYEEVKPPDHPDKIVHIRNHWRRRPGKLSGRKRDNAGPPAQPR